MSEQHGHNPEETAHLVALGPVLITKLVALLRTVKTHEITNQLFIRQAQEFVALINGSFEDSGEDELTLVAVADYFYLNGVRLRVGASLLPVQHTLHQEFENRSVGGIRFLPALREAEFERFFQLFLAAEDQGLAERLVEACRAASIEHAIPLPHEEIDAEELLAQLGDEKAEKTERSKAKRVFWRAVLGTKKIMLRARSTGRPDLRHAKRLVQPIVDSVMKHEHSIVGLTALKDHDEYTYAHCVNVSVMSVSMAQQLGLPRQGLADLGVAALLHDLGKLAVPIQILQKPAKLSPEEWDVMRRHPIEGMKFLTRLPGLSPLTLDAMRVAFEHHMNLGGTGYPEVSIEWRQCTSSRIVAVADVFDALTAHRAYHRRPLSTYEALAHLMGPVRIQFDQAVLWALLKTVGLYPPGTLLMLDSGHIVLSLSPNPEDPRRPVVRVVVHPDGTMGSQEQPEDWNPLPAERTVGRVLPPEEVTVETKEYLAA
jgi:HD-GYP domain-containing protein (c-di-GMP phosphodiesterase class II)